MRVRPLNVVMTVVIVSTVVIIASTIKSWLSPSTSAMFVPLNNDARYPIGSILVFVLTPVTLLTTGVFFVRRGIQPIRFRSPYLVLGTIACVSIVLLLVAALSMFPDNFNCELVGVIIVSLLSLVIALVGARVWLLLFAFNLQEERLALQLRSSQEQSNAAGSTMETDMNSWFVSHRNLASKSGLAMGIILLTTLLSAASWVVYLTGSATAAFVPVDTRMMTPALGCSARPVLSTTVNAFTRIQLSICGPMFAVLACKLRGFHEGFYIKMEMMSLSAILTVSSAMYFMLEALLPSGLFNYMLQNGFELAIAFVVHLAILLVSIVLPTVQSYTQRGRYHNNASVSSSIAADVGSSMIESRDNASHTGRDTTLAICLQSTALTTAYGHFLKSELSIENLLFYIEGHDYMRRVGLFVDPMTNIKNQSANAVVNSSSLKLYHEGQNLYMTYLKESAPLEISVSPERREDLERCLGEKRHSSISVMTASFVTLEQHEYDQLGRQKVSHLLINVRDIMKDLLSEIYDNMERDSFQRFLNSRAYHLAAIEANGIGGGLATADPFHNRAQLEAWKS